MRLIDADALIVEIKELLEVAEDNWEYEAVEECKKVIEEISEQPTIQPQTGKWIVTDEAGHAKCSKCGVSIDLGGGDYHNYCPNCGANMR